MADLRPEFIDHASPEAIRAELAKARAALTRHERRVVRLQELLNARLDQIEAGAWPRAVAGSGEPDKRGTQ